MDIFLPIILCLIFIILFSLCGWCCKRHREGTVYGYNGTPVTVTTTHVTATPVVMPPYPVEPMHPTPHTIGVGGPPPVGFVPAGGQAYPAYMGYPPTSGAAPYPPAGPYATGPLSQTAPPPSYSEAVAQPPPTMPMPNMQHDVYAKQSPYNPTYQ